MRYQPLVFCAALLLSVASNAHEKQLTIERVFSSPELDGRLMLGLKFSPKGNRLTFLRPKPNNYEILDLWEIDSKTGESHALIDADNLKFGPLSEEEKARRERLRISRGGIVEYHWFNDGERVVLPAGGDLYLYTVNSQKLQRLTNDKSSEVDVKVSPNDNYISFTKDQNLYLLDLKSSAVKVVTTDGKEAISNGIAEFIAQEEMDRYTGYWWSKDESYLAFTRVDESSVKLIERYDIDADKVIVHKQRYPEAGTANALIQLAVVKVQDVLQGRANPQWVDLGKDKDIYLANAHWNSDGQLIYEIQTRNQKKLSVFSYDPISQKQKKLLSESDSKWVNLHKDTKMLQKSKRWIWASERSGYKHLYLYKNDGTELYPLTSGKWPVAALLGVDEFNGWVYFTASQNSPLEQQIYRVSLEKPGAPEPVIKTDGWNDGVMSEKADVIVQFHSSPLTPQQVYLKTANGEAISTLSNNEVKSGHPLFPYKDSLVAPEFGSFKAATGEVLFYQLYKPKSFNASQKYPLVMIGYGGPGRQVVRKAWNRKTGLITQVLLNKGFVVASVDNRGSSNRGKKFEDHLYRAFGTVEVEDQVAAVKHLVSQGFIDKSRVGFFGWSYGGFLAMSLAVKAPGVFKAHVAAAPVTDFALYDTHYTEHYLGDPRKEQSVYKRVSVLPLIPQITGHVLVIHGMADDNVLFSNSTLLFKEFQKAGKLYESVTYPGAKHGIYGKDNLIHVYKTITNYFERRL